MDEGDDNPTDDDRLDQLDYYTLLQVDPKADRQGVKNAFHAFALRYHPDAHVGAPDDKRRRATEIYRRGAEAYEVLLDDELRAEYDLQLAEGHLRYDEEVAKKRREPPKEEPKKFMFRTQEGKDLTQKAQAAFKAGNLPLALQHLKDARYYEPDNALINQFIEQLESQLLGF